MELFTVLLVVKLRKMVRSWNSNLRCQHTRQSQVQFIRPDQTARLRGVFHPPRRWQTQQPWGQKSVSRDVISREPMQRPGAQRQSSLGCDLLTSPYRPAAASLLHRHSPARPGTQAVVSPALLRTTVVKSTTPQQGSGSGDGVCFFC